jgi:hypothetical protein
MEFYYFFSTLTSPAPTDIFPESSLPSLIPYVLPYLSEAPQAHMLL